MDDISGIAIALLPIAWMPRYHLYCTRLWIVPHALTRFDPGRMDFLSPVPKEKAKSTPSVMAVPVCQIRHPLMGLPVPVSEP